MYTGKEREMREIWDSFEHLFRADLERLDFRVRAMVSEMGVAGCNKKLQDQFIPEAFAALWKDVVRTQDEKYSAKGRKK